MVIEELFTKLGFEVDPAGIDKGKKMLSGFKTWIGGLALGAGFVTLAKTGLDAAMTMEGLNAQFTVMTGSAERAKGVIDEIAAFAAKTPFDKLGLSNAAKTLMAFGMSADSVVPTLKMLGDVAGADQNKLNSLALVFGQLQSAGKLTGGDFLQLINQGFNPLTIISQKTGIAVAELKDQMSKGAITADMVTAAFRAATSEGGLFFGNSEAQSQTLAGKLSTLKDNFVTALQNMAEAFLPLLKAGTDVLIAFDWTPIVSTIQDAAGVVNFLVENLGTLLTWLKRLSPLLVLVFGPKLIAMITSAIVSTRLYSGALAFVQRAHLAAGAAANYQLTAIGLLKSAMFSAGQAAKSFGTAMKGAIAAALNPISLVLVGLTAIKELYDYFITDAKEELKKDFEKIDVELFKEGLGAEGNMKMRETVYQNEKKKYTKMITGETPATEAQKDAAKKSFEDAKASYQEGLGLYKAARGIEWSTYKAKAASKKRADSGEVGTPGMSSGNKDLERAFAEMQKALSANTDATKKNTKAKEKPFDITALSRQAFDAAFNVKLRELTLGSI